MAKATGKLISATSEDFRGDRFARVGATVTIELPRGMKVIGTCVQCKLYEECGIMEALIYCENKHWKKFAEVGCGLWKPKKGARE